MKVARFLVRRRCPEVLSAGAYRNPDPVLPITVHVIAVPVANIDHPCSASRLFKVIPNDARKYRPEQADACYVCEHMGGLL